jgi:hypothetical protein
MVVRKLDELIDLVLKGWKPYYHRGVCRRYLRRGNRRILIDRNLDRDAEEIHKISEDLKKCRDVARRELLKKALTVNGVIKIAGVQRSTLYRYL